jgi:uncharacterized protein (DUF924 family)
LGRHVDADHGAAGPHLPRGKKGVEASAAAEIEHGLPCAQGGDGLRVATTQPHVGPFRRLGELVGGVAQRQARAWGRSTAARGTAHSSVAFRHLAVVIANSIANFILRLRHCRPRVRKDGRLLGWTQEIVKTLHEAGFPGQGRFLESIRLWSTSWIYELLRTVGALHHQEAVMSRSTEELSAAILDYWFSSLDDAALLDRQVEPFRTCFQRWYGKQPAIDEEIRTRFEPVLLAITRDGRGWDQQVADWQRAPLGLLALVILLDQFPRNMYRDSARMYAFDHLALSVTTLAIRDYEARPLSLVQRMFLYVPLMHVEDLTLQQAMVARFESLAALAAERSPENKNFFAFALEYARKHREVVETFGRFPHRNVILGRPSTAAELEFLQQAGSSF